jgi:hypothetical protein
VGNGFSPVLNITTGPQQSAFIDSCDLVVRLNWCQHYYFGWSGWKTDILIVRSAADAGTGGRMLNQYDVTIPYGVATGVGRVVVYAMSAWDTYESAVAPYLDRYEWHGKQVDLLPHAYEAMTRAACGASDKYAMMTLGAVALFWLLEQFPQAEVYLAGFSFHVAALQDQQTTHDYHAERDWINGLEQEGRLTILP